MGRIADSLRSSLRELAAADARLYRGLADELATIPALATAAQPALAPASDLDGQIAAAIALLTANGYTVSR